MELKFLGRSDTQIKLNGFRIELGETESAIMHTGLATRAVAALKDVPGSSMRTNVRRRKSNARSLAKRFRKFEYHSKR